MTEPSYLRATRAAYDTVAAEYAERFSRDLENTPLDRAILAAFAELVQAVGAGPVADIGCGPGHVTAYLHALGLTVFGIDLSPAMVAQARLAYPGLRFDEGSMTALDLTNGELGGIVARYSIIHTPPDRLPMVFAEFHRVLGLGGHLLLVFQVGDERVHVQEACGHSVSVDLFRRPPDQVEELLGRAGFVVLARLVREPDGIEKGQQASVLARKANSDV